MIRLEAARNYAQAQANREGAYRYIIKVGPDEYMVKDGNWISTTADIEVVEIIKPIFCHRDMVKAFNRVCPVDKHTEKGL